MYWPACSASQAKNIQGPAGYEFGHYCSEEWTVELNNVLSDPQVNQAITKFLAQVAFETGYFSTVYQPIDGGAGLIHMIPQNWPVNTRDMDELWPQPAGQASYETRVSQMGKNFFQTPTYGWKSVAAWFKRTNGVIPGCGKNLFFESYEMQTKCIFGWVNDRSQALTHATNCMAKFSSAASAQSSIVATETKADHSSGGSSPLVMPIAAAGAAFAVAGVLLALRKRHQKSSSGADAVATTL